MQLASMTEATRLAILRSQRLCPPSGVEPVHLFTALLAGNDAWAVLLRGLGFVAPKFELRREHSDPPVPISESVNRAIDTALAECARRRHWMVSPAHVVLAMLVDDDLDDVLDDPADMLKRLTAALDELREAFPPWRPTSPA